MAESKLNNVEKFVLKEMIARLPQCKNKIIDDTRFPLGENFASLLFEREHCHSFAGSREAAIEWLFSPEYRDEVDVVKSNMEYHGVDKCDYIFSDPEYFQENLIWFVATNLVIRLDTFSGECDWPIELNDRTIQRITEEWQYALDLAKYPRRIGRVKV